MYVTPFKKKISINYLESYLINLSKEAIKYINSSKINILNNKGDGTALSKADLQRAIKNFSFHSCY